MEIYLVVLIVLIITAIVDLVVGVSNDAVNFLSSSVGSKAAPMRVIMIVASAGIMLGVTFSSGMMEIARNGVIYPEHYLMTELMYIFFAIMISDVLVINLFNTFGLPTSTTVSIVSELTGAGFALAVIRLTQSGQDFSHIAEYLNLSKVFVIFTAIFVSIIVSFIFGVIVQFISRVIFTFDYKTRIKRYGAVWGAFALTFISYFILIKGAKGASFLSESTVLWIKDNTILILGTNFILWAFALHTLLLLTKFNIFKFIVLIGTFALAMSFAANDLVNFIGVPLAALSTYTIAAASPDPMNLTMEALNHPLKTNTLILLFAGAVMVVTLFISQKARSVTKTTLLLGRQDEGYERFESLPASRAIVRMVLSASDFVQRITPESWKKNLADRLDVTKYQPEKIKVGEEQASFDLIRAAVNLMVAATLIALGTSFKLPLSTTYVTFIVAMATALPDKAWGRESAVYRVSGVLTVIGGWLITAFIAGSLSFSIAFAVYYGGFPVVIGLVLVAIFIFYRTDKLFKRRKAKMIKEEERLADKEITSVNLLSEVFYKIANLMLEMKSLFSKNFNSLFEHKLSHSAKVNKSTHILLLQIDFSIHEIMLMIRNSKPKNMDLGHKYGQTFGALHDMALSLDHIAQQCKIFIDNNHKPFVEEEAQEITELTEIANNILRLAISSLQTLQFTNNNELNSLEKVLGEKLQKYLKHQIKRASKYSKNSKRSILFINLLEAIRNISRNAVVITTLCCEIQREYNAKDDSPETGQKILPE